MPDKTVPAFELIESPQNPFVRELVKLQRSKRQRVKQGKIVLEGATLIGEALAHRVEVLALALADTFVLETKGLGLEGRELGEALGRIPRRVRLPDSLLQQASSLSTSPGVIALARRPALSLATAFSDEPQTGPILVVNDIQDPGNLGALTRTAEATGCRAVILCGESADPFSPKALRGSMGSLLRVRIVEARDAIEATRFMRDAGRLLIGAAPRHGVDYRSYDWPPPFALFVGGEARGLTSSVSEAMDILVTIPMAAPVESLNVSVASGLLLFESLRGRTQGG